MVLPPMVLAAALCPELRRICNAFCRCPADWRVVSEGMPPASEVVVLRLSATLFRALRGGGASTRTPSPASEAASTSAMRLLPWLAWKGESPPACCCMLACMLAADCAPIEVRG